MLCCHSCERYFHILVWLVTAFFAMKQVKEFPEHSDAPIASLACCKTVVRIFKYIKLTFYI